MLFCIFFFTTAGHCLAVEEKDLTRKHKKPPLLVTVEEVDKGSIQPMAEFIGTTSFSRVSHVAADIDGLVKKVNFDVGEKVVKGAQLVLLDSELLDMDIIGTKAEYEQNIVDLKNAQRDFKRIDTLYKEKSISETKHDLFFSQKKRLEKRSIVLESKLNKLLIIKRKKIISAPFSGIIIEKSTEIGEWLPKGGKVAVVADNARIDVLVQVTADIFEHLNQENRVRLTIGTKEKTATFHSFIPKGDLATRTFTAKFRLDQPCGFVEGLEALLPLPNGPRAEGFLVPRDAVVDKYGKTMVFLAIDKKAKMVPIQVAGFVGLKALITGEGLEKGLEIIVKGSKRVTDGQQVQFKKIE